MSKISMYKEIRRNFRAYLKGYMMYFDLYPVCERHIFSKNDSYALLQDFFAIGDDMNKSIQRLISAPDEEFADTNMGQDEIRRRIEAVKKTLAAIEQTRSKLAKDSE